jgi:hypothetical protein
LNPLRNGRPGAGHDLELDWALGLLLKDHRAGSYLPAVADIRDSQFQQITGSKLAVDRQIEKRQITMSLFYLKSSSDRPNFLQFERQLLSDELAFVPGPLILVVLE